MGKTKQLIDVRKREVKTQQPLYMKGAEVEQLNSFRFLHLLIYTLLLSLLFSDGLNISCFYCHI